MRNGDSLNKELRYTAEELLEAIEIMSQDYNIICVLDKASGMVEVYHCIMAPETVRKKMMWEDFFRNHIEKHIYKEDILKLYQALLPETLCEQETSKVMEIRNIKSDGSIGWSEMTIRQTSSQKRILLLSKNINEQRFQRNIVDLFVYQNCDYFVSLDAQNNSYKMHGGNGSLPVLPDESDDYQGAFDDYVDRYIVQEDQKKAHQQGKLKYIVTQLESQPEYSFSYGLFDEGGNYRRKRLQYIYYDKASGKILMTRSDITASFLESIRLEQAIWLAQRDPLTGIYNHQATINLIQRSLAERANQKQALLFVDMDSFKMVNDILGHGCGDQLLQSVAQSLRKSIRQEDIVGRVGGDEFVILLRDIVSRKTVEQCVQRIHHTLLQIPGNNLQTSCSIGIALYPEHGKDCNTLTQKADRAMYVVKESGKRDFAFWEDAFSKEEVENE